MRRGEAGTYLPSECQRAESGRGESRCSTAARFAPCTYLHRQVQGGPLFTQIVNADDVWVSHLTSQLQFTLEAFLKLA